MNNLISKDQFVALSEFCYDCPTKPSLQNILVTDNALVATDGHIIGVLTSSDNTDFSDKDSYQAYGYNTKIGRTKLTESRRAGYDQDSEIYDLTEREYDDGVQWPSSDSISRVIPADGKITISFDEDNIVPLEMLADHSNCDLVSVFIQGDVVVYVATIKTQNIIKHFSIRHPLTEFDGVPGIPEFHHVTNFNPNYLIDIWNLVKSIGCTEFSLQINSDKTAMRFDASNDHQKVFGALMPVQVREGFSDVVEVAKQ